MKKNMGSVDRIIRLVVALVLGVLVFTGTVSGTLAVILGIVAVIFLLTSMVSFCPLYAPFHLSTRKKEEAAQG
ncbi:YgaP family membrane protein [Rhodocaloribacter sp.]